MLGSGEIGVQAHGLYSHEKNLEDLCATACSSPDNLCTLIAAVVVVGWGFFRVLLAGLQSCGGLLPQCREVTAAIMHVAIMCCGSTGKLIIGLDERD